MDALALLRLQMEWGADEALEEVPLDRTSVDRTGVDRTGVDRTGVDRTGAAGRPAGRPALGQQAAPAARTPLAAVAPQSGGDDAKQVAAAATTLEALRAAIGAFEGCGLRSTASNLIFADGNPQAGLLIIGDAPSAAEDRSGRAFDGPAGAYLDRMLQSIGLDRQAALLTPLVPWRPPGGRPPTPAEIAACLPFLQRLIVLTAPRRIVLLGRLAARTMLSTVPRRPEGTWLSASIPDLPDPLPALVMPGLEKLAAGPAERRAAWAGLRLLRRALDSDLARS
jgi:uracil-DNA glycosylase family 4